MMSKTRSSLSNKPSLRARLLAGLRTAIGWFPLTFQGILLGAIGAFAYFDLARESADFIILAVGATAMGLVGLSLVSMLIFGPIFALTVRGKKDPVVPEQMTTGVEVETGFSTLGLRYWPVLFVRWAWTSPEGANVEIKARRGRLIEVVTPDERGHYESIERRFVIRDVFGFTKVSFSRRWQTTIRVLPVVGRANVELAIRRATDDGYSHPAGQPLGELVEMRRYQPGDPVRHIIWKAFARTRKLMVREAERAIAPKPAMVGYFIAGPNDEPSASTARLFLEEGLLGSDFVFSAAGARKATANVSDALEQVVASRAHRDAGADGLASLIRTVDRGRLDNLIVFAPAGDGPWVDRLLEQTRRLPRPPMVIMTVDGQLGDVTQARAKAGMWDRLFNKPGDRRRELAGISEVHQRLRRSGAEVKLLHRGSGSRLDATTLDAWRAAV